MEAIRQGDIPGVQLRRRGVVPGSSRDVVWPFLVDADKLSLWLCGRAQVGEGAGAVFRLETDLDDGGLRSEFLEVVERLEGEQLVLGFRQLDVGWTAATKVTLALSEREEGCGVMVFQEGFQQLPLSAGLTAWEHSRARWSRALDRLSRVAGREPRVGP